MGDYSEALSMPSGAIQSQISTPFGIDTPDLSEVDWGKTTQQLATEGQEAMLGVQQQQNAQLGSMLEDAHRFGSYLPTLYDGPTALDLARGGDKQDAIYERMVREGRESFNRDNAPVTNLSALPQTRKDPNQFRPDSTANAFKGLFGWLGLDKLGVVNTPFNPQKGQFGDYGQGNLAGIMYGLNLPFQVALGSLNEINNKRNEAVNWIGQQGAIGQGIKNVLNFNPISEIDKFVNREVPNYQPISLFHDNNTRDNDIVNAIRGVSPQSFSSYRDDPKAFIGLRMQRGVNGLKWYQDPSLWAGAAADIVADPSDILFGATFKGLKKATAKVDSGLAKGHWMPPGTGPKTPNVPKGGVSQRSPTLLTQVQRATGEVAQGVYTPPPVGRGNFSQTPLKAPSLSSVPSSSPGRKPLPPLSTKEPLKPLVPPPRLEAAMPKLSLDQKSVPLPNLPSKSVARVENAVSSRVFSGEYTLSEMADILSTTKPGSFINVETLKKNRRTITELEALARIIPGPDGIPIIPPGTPDRYFRTWKQLKERIWSLPDSSYKRIFAEYGPKIPVKELASGNFVITLPDGTPLTPTLTKPSLDTPGLKVYTDPSVIDPKFASSKGTPKQGGTVFDQARFQKAQAKEKMMNARTKQQRAKAQVEYDDATRKLVSPDVIEESVPIAPTPKRQTRAEQRKAYLDAVNKAPKAPLNKADDPTLVTKERRVNPEVILGLHKEVLPSELQSTDAVKLQGYIDARTNFSNISDEVRTASLEVRSARESLDSFSTKVDGQTPDIGRQPSDPDAYPEIPNAQRGILPTNEVGGGGRVQQTDVVPGVGREPSDVLPSDELVGGGTTPTREAVEGALTVYHGTRVKGLDFTADPFLGSGRSELGPAHHFTTDPDAATTYARAEMPKGLPPVTTRTFDAEPTLYKAEVSIDRTQMIDFNEAPKAGPKKIFEQTAQSVLDPSDPLDRRAWKIFTKMNEKAKTYKELYANFDRAVWKAYSNQPNVKILDSFQRQVNAKLYDMGVKGYYGTLPDGSMQVSLFDGNLIRGVSNTPVGDKLLDDALTVRANRVNADSISASQHPDSPLNDVYFQESKAQLQAQIVDDLEVKLENALEEQATQLSKVYESMKELEDAAKVEKAQKLINIEQTITDHQDEIMRHLDRPNDTPCGL